MIAYATIISVYAPTITNSKEIKEGFYSILRDVVKTVSIKDKLIIAGDFNASVGKEVENWLRCHWPKWDWEVQLKWQNASCILF